MQLLWAGLIKQWKKYFLLLFLTFDPFTLVVITAFIIAVYSSASGLLGTARTDSFQFVFAMIGCIVSCNNCCSKTRNWKSGSIKDKITMLQLLNFFHQLVNFGADKAMTGVFAISVGAFIAHVGLQWWSSWYPGADPGGGGYVAQRMMSAKDEKNSVFATLWFTIAHYAVRPWPWIIVALAALVLLPRSTVEELKIENSEYYAISEKIHSKQDLSEE